MKRPPGSASGRPDVTVDPTAMSAESIAGPGFRIPVAALHTTAARASGPGGQRVNKVSTKIDLRVHPGDIEGLSDYQRRRLAHRIGARHWDAEGRLRVQSQRFREQPRNFQDACDKLVALVAEALVVQKARRPTRPGRGAVERRLSDKRRLSDRKRARERPLDG